MWLKDGLNAKSGVNILDSKLHRLNFNLIQAEIIISNLDNALVIFNIHVAAYLMNKSSAMQQDFMEIRTFFEWFQTFVQLCIGKAVMLDPLA